MSERTSCDPVILRELAAGTITTDPDAGCIIRRNGRRAYGRPNGPRGYLGAHLAGRTVLVHRVIWMDANGPYPPGLETNHINGNTADNRLVNL